MSERIVGVLGGGDDGWAIFHAARALEANGVAVTNLTIGEHDIRTDPAILRAMDASARGGHTGYAALAGIPALRAAIAQRVTARTGVPTTPEHVLITAGGQAALFAACMACCDPGDGVLMPDPYYATYPGTIRAADAVPRAVACRPEDGFLPTRSALEAAGPARALLLNTPNNPTGAIYPEETVRMLAELAAVRDLWVISDEVYDTQIWEGAHVSPRCFAPERTLVVGSMSKSHAMTGSRIGWIVAPPQVTERLLGLVVHTTYGVPGFIQDAALSALSLGEAFEARVSAPFRRRRDAALTRLAERLPAVPSGGAMYLMLDIRARAPSGTAFAEALLAKHRIAVMPGESFGAAAAGHIRVALTVEDDALLAAIDTIATFRVADAA